MLSIMGNVVNLPRAEITICFSLMNNEMSFREVILSLCLDKQFVISPVISGSICKEQ